MIIGSSSYSRKTGNLFHFICGVNTDSQYLAVTCQLNLDGNFNFNNKCISQSQKWFSKL